MVAIADGDTITVMHRGAPERIRLYGIDTPETDQKFGSQARIFTFQMVNAKKVKVIPPIGTDTAGPSGGCMWMEDA